MLDELLKGDTIKSYQQTPTITICTDASWSATHKIGAWACYMKSDKKLVKYGGIITTPCINSTEAERIGLANALWLANKLVDIKTHRIIIYCDNKAAVKPTKLSNKRGRRKQAAKAQLEFYSKNIQSHFDRAKITDIRHVKAHLKKTKRDNRLTRYFMQDWCDKHARSLLRAHCGKL